MLQPIRNRVLVRPDPPEDVTASGLIIPDNAKHHVAMSGEVVALGPECHGPAYRVRAATLAAVEEALDRVAGQERDPDALVEKFRTSLRGLLAGFYDASQDVRIGAHVCFSSEHATDISEGDGPLVLIAEPQIAATWMPDDVAVSAVA